MKNYLVALLSLTMLSSHGLFAQKHGSGLEFDDNTYQETDRLSPALRFTSKDLPAFSLKKYCPTPGDQGQMGSCVGWATGYAALTITVAIADSIESTEAITKLARSPLYIYNQIKLHGCDPGGSRFNDALNLIKTKGDCKKIDFDPVDCNVAPDGEVNTKAGSFRIKEFYNLFGITDNPDAKIAAVVNSLNAKKPVVVGINLTPTFDNVDATGVWAPSPDEKINGGHAVCVIGYNNLLKRFELINSYGTGWGNKGFFTMSFSDFARVCKYGYQIVLQKGGEGGVASSNKQIISGTFKFKKLVSYDQDKDTYTFTEVAPTLVNKYYTFPEGSVKKDDFYRIVASGMQKDNYVYIFSVKPDNTSEVIFPLSLSQEGSNVKDIAIVPSNDASVEIPVDEKKGLSTDQTGVDYLCILYSTAKIDDIKDVVARVNNAQGEFMARLQQVLGNRLIPANEINYSSNLMGFTAPAAGAGSIAPIILRVNVTQ